MHTVHLIVLIFSLLLDTEFLQSGVHVQLIGLQLPQECFPLCSQTDTQNMKKQKSPRPTTKQKLHCGKKKVTWSCRKGMLKNLCKYFKPKPFFIEDSA